MKFREFLYNCEIVSVEEQLEENELLGSTDPNLKKFKVTFRYPRNKRDALLGHYTDATMYVQAASANDAKNTVVNWVRTKLDADESTDQKSKNNYLRDIKYNNMQLRSKPVSTWNDILQLLTYLAVTPGVKDPLSFFGDDELRILLKKAYDKNFNKQVASLPPKAKRLLKKIYDYVVAHKDYFSSNIHDLLGNKAQYSINYASKQQPKQQEFDFPSEPQEDDEFAGEAPSGWIFHSVFEPKGYDYEDQLDQLHSVADVIKAARQYGIDYASLRELRQSLQHVHETTLDGRRHLWWELRQKLRISPKNRIFDSDYANPELAKRYNIHWDELTELLMQSQEFNYNIFFPYYGRDVERYYNDAAQWLWDFYKAGPPKETKTGLQKWKEALAYLLEQRRQHYGSQEVPF